MKDSSHLVLYLHVACLMPRFRAWCLIWVYEFFRDRLKELHARCEGKSGFDRDFDLDGLPRNSSFFLVHAISVSTMSCSAEPFLVVAPDSRVGWRVM